MSLSLNYLVKNPIIALPDSLRDSQTMSRWNDLLKKVEDRLSIRMIKHDPVIHSPSCGHRLVFYRAVAHTADFEFLIVLILAIPDTQSAQQGLTFPQLATLEIFWAKFGLRFMDEALREFSGSYGVLYLEYDVPFELESDAWPWE